MLPSTAIDRRVEDHDVYIFDISALQARYCSLQGSKKVWEPICDRFYHLRRQPDDLERTSQNGINQLLTKINFIGDNRTILAPRQRTELKEQLAYQRKKRREEHTVPEKQYGLVQYGTYDMVKGLEEETPPDYEKFLEIIEQIMTDLEQQYRAKWKQANHCSRLSRADKSIAAVAGALAYTGTSACVLTRDASIVQVIQALPNMLGKPSNTLSVGGSILSDVNAQSGVRIL